MWCGAGSLMLRGCLPVWSPEILLRSIASLTQLSTRTCQLNTYAHNNGKLFNVTMTPNHINTRPCTGREKSKKNKEPKPWYDTKIMQIIHNKTPPWPGDWFTWCTGCGSAFHAISIYFFHLEGRGCMPLLVRGKDSLQCETMNHYPASGYHWPFQFRLKRVILCVSEKWMT